MPLLVNYRISLAPSTKELQGDLILFSVAICFCIAAVLNLPPGAMLWALAMLVTVLGYATKSLLWLRAIKFETLSTRQMVEMLGILEVVDAAEQVLLLGWFDRIEVEKMTVQILWTELYTTLAASPVRRDPVVCGKLESLAARLMLESKTAASVIVATRLLHECKTAEGLSLSSLARLIEMETPRAV